MDDTARFAYGWGYHMNVAALWWARSITPFLSQVCVSQARKVSKHLWDGDFTSQ